MSVIKEKLIAARAKRHAPEDSQEEKSVKKEKTVKQEETVKQEKTVKQEVKQEIKEEIKEDTTISEKNLKAEMRQERLSKMKEKHTAKVAKAAPYTYTSSICALRLHRVIVLQHASFYNSLLCTICNHI